MFLQFYQIKKYHVFCDAKSPLFIFILCILLFTPLHTQSIQEYSQIVCGKKPTKFCKNIKDLLYSLEILEKIQINNARLLQQREQLSSQNIDYHQLQKEHIILVSYEEYLSLKESLQRFCKSFKKLHHDEKNVLFSLLWNEKLLFENESDIITFCKQQY